MMVPAVDWMWMGEDMGDPYREKEKIFHKLTIFSLIFHRHQGSFLPWNQLDTPFSSVSTAL